MNLITFKPDVQTKLEGSAIRIDDYLGMKDVKGLEFHEYAVTKVSRADGTSLGSAKKMSTISPEELEVDDKGCLVESVNRLQRPREDGSQPLIVKVGSKIVFGADYTEWK